ncbi:DNA polymerase [Bienertia sinuspersici]
MQKAQKLCWEQYSVDIEEVITNSSLSLRIFRSLFYDVNSLYPFIMKSFSMPGGKPVWKGNLANADLSNLFGFIEAYVYCPAEIKRPFLPYRGKDKTLIFPTGEFVGVYYSEELKYAKSLGYTVIPLSGYIFEEMESPFKSYVSTLFESRLQAKKEGNDALSFVYKILMNSLYGRFGINPESTLTEICDFQRYRKLMQDPSFVSAYNISKENYIVSYRSNMDDEMYQWEPPKNSAVHISAAVTANARIYMYPFISRDDCYYTDTDSVVLGSPLPEEGLSSIELGKFKLEDHIKEGIFYAPKSYWYCTEVDKEVLKFKGAAKSYVTKEWFQNKKEDPTYSKDFEVENLFTRDWANLRVTLQKKSYHLGKEQNNKRIHLRDGTTLPIHMKDISAIEDLSPKMSKSLIYNLRTLHEKIMKNEAIKKEEEQLEKQESEDTKHTLEDNSDPDP